MLGRARMRSSNTVTSIWMAVKVLSKGKTEIALSHETLSHTYIIGSEPFCQVTNLLLMIMATEQKAKLPTLRTVSRLSWLVCINLNLRNLTQAWPLGISQGPGGRLPDKGALSLRWFNIRCLMNPRCGNLQISNKIHILIPGKTQTGFQGCTSGRVTWTARVPTSCCSSNTNSPGQLGFSQCKSS